MDIPRKENRNKYYINVMGVEAYSNIGNKAKLYY